MAKGIEKDALANAGTAGSQSAAAYQAASPIYAQLAQGNTGYTPQQTADQLTSSQQTLGGGIASAVGQNGLTAARTGNAGGNPLALDDAARGAGVTQSGNALDVAKANADLMQKNRNIGLAGESGIYSDANSTANANLNTANTAAANNPWLKLLQSTIAAGGQVGAAAAGA